MSSFKVNCFSSWDEWSIVREGLFSSSRDDQLKALSIVQVWRCRGGIPSSVDSTAQIVDSILRDTSPHHRASADEIQLLYSVVIIRAVNLIVEPNQQGFYADSVLNLALQAGIPGWIVELRHEATHKQLPSLSVLRTAAQFLLRWYQEHYWEPQYEFLRSHTLVCMECCHKSKNQKRALREAPSKIRRIESFAKDIAIPVVLTHWDAEITQILHQFHQGLIQQNNLLSTSILSSLALFDQWKETLRIIQHPNEGNLSIICQSPDQFLIPVLSHILSLLVNDADDEILSIRVCFVYVWVHRLLQCFYDKETSISLQMPSIDLIKRNFTRTALNLSKNIISKIELNRFQLLVVRKGLLQKLFSINHAIENYVENDMEGLRSVLSDFETLLRHNKIGTDQLISSNDEKDIIQHANISKNATSTSTGDLDSMEQWLANLKSNQKNLVTFDDNNKFGNSQPLAKRKKVIQEDFDYNSCTTLWPLGLVPGRTNCSDLLLLELDQNQ